MEKGGTMASRPIVPYFAALETLRQHTPRGSFTNGRHRYEFNNDYIDAFEKAGMKPVGINPDSNLVEAVELEGHPWFIGVQYHPEYKSTVSRPHPLFRAFVAAGGSLRSRQA